MKPQKRSSKCSIVNRTVSFNIEDPYQRALLERSQQLTNFSAAVKRWLAGETTPSVQSYQSTNPTLQPHQPVHEPVPDDFDPVSALF
ncbi:hypothetical protein [Alicyclobacillus sp. SO9]|uniref:hypothetical protein n=1 Tax=Alicyclobacillus sp. SO9 TaxID=2665646 RepID=UPI0018E7B643|nr:hypothetical protein [Alicyclobacillus sp. SO9]QQE81531.1 hypothetical protein GI364_24845 [Alicyclobacillus sp. SO9]